MIDRVASRIRPRLPAMIPSTVERALKFLDESELVRFSQMETVTRRTTEHGESEGPE